MLNVYIGYDQREAEAYNVLEYSIRKRSPEVDVKALVQAELRQAGIYNRPKDNASTEFSLTRFLVPFLNGYEDWAVFMDCDMLVTDDILKLFHLADSRYAVQVVKHLHHPFESTKMDAQKQIPYPRKNWSSVMLFNCGHEKNKNLTPEVINTVQPSFLHRFEWLDDKDIGELPMQWNFLVDYYKMPKLDCSLPANLHWTSGGPWFEDYKDVDYADLWFKEYEEMENEGRRKAS